MSCTKQFMPDVKEIATNVFWTLTVTGRLFQVLCYKWYTWFVKYKMSLKKELTGFPLAYIDNDVSSSISKTLPLAKGKEMFYLTMHSTHFIYSYMELDIW